MRLVNRRTFFIWLTIYFALLATITISNLVGPDLWWLGSVNLYLPQVIWAVPGVVLLLLAIRIGWRGLLPSILCLLWVAGPIMGYNFPTHAATRHAGQVRIRILTYNVKSGRRDANEEAEEIVRAQPDLIQFQDGDEVLETTVRDVLAGYEVQHVDQFVVASRLPITSIQYMDLGGIGYGHNFVRSVVDIGNRQVALYDVHLLSPRAGLHAVRDIDIGGLDVNVDTRSQESRSLAQYLKLETLPVVVTGDFNAPMQSLVCRRLLNVGMRDAFCEAGSGYGYTYGAYTPARFPYVRIDHIFYRGPIGAQTCWVGNDEGSDHCPIIADLVVNQ